MALPTVSRTWQFKNNLYLPTTGNVTTNIRKLIWTIKDALTTFGTNPWVCVGSSDAVTCYRFGVDALGPPGPAYDLWGTPFNAAKLHYRASDGWSSYDSAYSSKHSWIILRNTQLDTTYDVCIDLNNNQNSDHNTNAIRFLKVMVCRSYNLTGSGSITARPSPSSGYAEVDLRNGNFDSYGTINGQRDWDHNYRVHVHMSTDGLATRVFTQTDCVTSGFWAFERIEGADTAYVNPVWAVGRGSYDWGTASTSYAWLHDSAVQQYDAVADSWRRFYLTCEGLGSSALPEAWSGYPNEVSGKWALCPVGVAQDYNPARGRVGYLKDMWWFSTGVYHPTFPPDGSRQLVAFNHLVVPWDGGNYYTAAYA